MKKPNAITVYLTPKGKIIDKDTIKKLSKHKSIIFLSGRYEDIDYRLIEKKIDLEISLGDFLISGGDLAIIVVIDAISRLLKDVIKNNDSIEVESFNNDLLDYKQYTKPNIIMEQKIPNILLSGDHIKVKNWRHMQRLGLTFLRRPDLLFNKKLSSFDKTLLNTFILKNINKR
jgi:tRNA (guanine37-N1)-methyltransferase